jgi:hypothetical protein
MAIHKLNIEDFDYDDEFVLIAIHTSLEDYRLCYFINQILNISLKKADYEVLISNKNGETNFSKFDFDDQKKNVFWHLVQNKNKISIKEKSTNFNLFQNTTIESSTKVYLLPEFKKVDYLLKIDNENDTINETEITTLLNSIERISTVYSIDLNTIKNKNNLIFK